MPGIPDEKMLHAAADWWLRLRNHDGSDDIIEQWLTWTRADRLHMEAFERVTELGERLGTIDAFTRRQWIDEFAPPVVARRSWLPLAAAAAAVFALFGGYVAWSTFNAAVTTASYTSAVAQNRIINLPDGSTVTMGEPPCLPQGLRAANAVLNSVPVRHFSRWRITPNSHLS